MINLLLLLVSFIGPATFAATIEQHGCSLINNQGELVEEYVVSENKEGSDLKKLYVKRTVFFTDHLVYKKGSNELVNDVRAMQITADNTEYYTVESEFEVVQNYVFDLQLSGIQRGSYKNYESNNEIEFKNRVFVKNANTDIFLYKETPFIARAKFLNNDESFSLTIERKAPGAKDFVDYLRTLITCPKK